MQGLLSMVFLCLVLAQLLPSLMGTALSGFLLTFYKVLGTFLEPIPMKGSIVLVVNSFIPIGLALVAIQQLVVIVSNKKGAGYNRRLFFTYLQLLELP